MESKEIRSLLPEEINEKVKGYKSELLNLRFQASVKQLANPMRIRAVRKNIARLITIFKEKINSQEV
ncbi:MAG: 50S ribosomal protein L29 [Oscillospiraceae bacterium]|jgi:large subunit ribosomal protein L29|nr:50S ribosomal protein L29 [Oscillospiraceae bacterium]